MSLETENLKRRLSVGPEYREDKTADGVEIWPTLSRAEIAEVMAEAADRIANLEAELSKAREALEQADQKAKEARFAALQEAATISVMMGEHLTMLPARLRKFPLAGGIIASKIRERCGPVDNLWTEANE